MSRTVLARLALVAAVLITLAVLWLGEWPLGVSGEWTWSRSPLSWDTVLGSLVASAVGGVYLVFVLAGRRRLPRANEAEACGWMAMLVVAAFVWLWTVQQSVPAPFNLAKVPWVLYYPRSSGYFWQARYEVTNAQQCLADYEQLMAERDYLHIGTHPPGLILAYRGLLHVCEDWPSVRKLLVATQPPAVRESFAVLKEPSNQQGGQVVEESDIASLWLAALLTQLAAAITTVGVYLLAPATHCPDIMGSSRAVAAGSCARCLSAEVGRAADAACGADGVVVAFRTRSELAGPLPAGGRDGLDRPDDQSRVSHGTAGHRRDHTDRNERTMETECTRSRSEAHAVASDDPATRRSAGRVWCARPLVGHRL